MMSRNLAIYGAVGVSALAYLLLPRRAFALEQVDIATGEISSAFTILPNATDHANARRAAEFHNSAQFSGWFNDPLHSITDVMAVWSIESNFKPAAIKRNDGGASNHAYGIGQVLGTTAGDFGISDPSSLLTLEAGSRVSMQYLEWSYNYLQERLGRAPSKAEWIGAYNAGVGAVLSGRLPDQYLIKFWAARTVELVL